MKVLLLAVAYLCCVAGWGGIALAMEPHWQQVRGMQPLPGSAALLLRTVGVTSILGALLLCLLADHPSMAALVWVLTLTAAAVTVTFTLAWFSATCAPRSKE